MRLALCRLVCVVFGHSNIPVTVNGQLTGGWRCTHCNREA